MRAISEQVKTTVRLDHVVVLFGRLKSQHPNSHTVLGSGKDRIRTFCVLVMFESFVVDGDDNHCDENSNRGDLSCASRYTNTPLHASRILLPYAIFSSDEIKNAVC